MVRTRTMGVVTTLAVAVTSGAAFVAPRVTAATPESASATVAKTPNVAKLAGSLAKQKISWSACEDRLQNAEGEVMCATVKVPKDWHDVDVKDTWDIELTHVENRDPDHSRYKGTIFTNPGGPGGDALVWPAEFTKALPDLNPYYNYLAFQPRGIDRPAFFSSATSQATCEYTHSGDDRWKEVEALGTTCSAKNDIQTLNTEQVSYDMDFIRHLMGLEKVDYIGYSYGTWLGGWYSKIFGAKYGGRFLLDSAVDVTEPSLGHAWIWAQAVARDRQPRLQQSLHIARLTGSNEGLQDGDVRTVLKDADAESFGVPAQAVVADKLLETKRAAARAKRPSEAWKPSPAAVRADLIRAELPSAEGDYAAMLRLQLTALKALGSSEVATAKSATTEPTVVTHNDYLRQIACNDGQWRQGKNWYEANFAKLTEAVQKYVFGGQHQECAYWRTDTVMPEVTDPENYPETIVIQAEFDTATDWEIGRVSGMKLPNTSFIAVDNESDHGVFPSGIEEVDGPVIDFFLTGERPPNVTVAPGLPMYGETVSYEGWTALDDKARHHGKPNTDPWRLAERQPTLTPVATTAAELLRPQVAGQEFRTWVGATYGPEGLEVLETIRE